MQILSISAGLLKIRFRMFCLRVGSVTNCSKKGHSVSNHPKKMKFETVPPPDFDENLHIWSICSEKKICQIIAYLVKYFPRYGPLKFC